MLAQHGDVLFWSDILVPTPQVAPLWTNNPEEGLQQLSSNCCAQACQKPQSPYSSRGRGYIKHSYISVSKQQNVTIHMS